MICNLKISKAETGAILPLIAVMLVAMIGIVALLIDTSRGTYTSNTIQEVADAASLSAVRQLNTKEEGWDNAVSAALLAIKSNRISEMPAGALDSLALNFNGRWGNRTVGKVGDISIAVARGMNWDVDGKSQFVSLEDGATYRPKGPWLHKDFSKKMFANAVRVEITLTKLNTTGFSKVQGSDAFTNLSKSSVAVSDSELDLPSFPGAISACQLMLNTDPHEMDDHMLTEYNPTKSVGREVFLTELEGFVTGADDEDSDLPSASEERREGLRRYLPHISYPIYDINGPNLCNNATSGKGVSCKHVPIQGLLGITSTTPGEASIDELRTHFNEAKSDDYKVRVGQHFKPLREWPLGDVSDFTNTMKQYIEEGGKTIDQQFVEIRHSRKFASPNFPAIKHAQVSHGVGDFMDRPLFYYHNLDQLTPNRINWPLKIADQEFRFGLLVGVPILGSPYVGRSPGQQFPKDGDTYAPFINPMCNSADKNLDKTNYNIKRVNVMVIAPGTDDSTYNNGEQVSYCDFDSQFQSLQQSARVPWYKNEPRVIGVVPIDFVGFNFEDLRLRFANGTPTYTSSEPGGLTIVDESPGGLELGAQYKNEVEQFESEYNDCEEDPENCQLNELATVNLPAEISTCFDDSNFVVFKSQIQTANNYANAYNVSKNQCNAQINVCNNIRRRCNNIDPETNPAGRQECEREYSQCPGLIQSCQSATNGYYNNLNQTLNNIGQANRNNNIFHIPSRPNVHCLPLPKEDAYDFGDSSNYEQPLSPLRPGRGCGGVRARVADEFREPISITSGKKRSEMTPIIVEDAQ